MDISNFMTWFLNQVINIFTWMFNLLDSIQFWGTSLLKISVAIIIIGSILPILLTLVNKGTSIAEYNIKVKEKNQKAYEKTEGK